MKNWLKDLKKGFGKINQIGKNFSRFGCFVCVLTLSLAFSFQSFADTYDHLLSGDDGEYITEYLYEDESEVSLMSSLATITNTVEWLPDVTTIRFVLHNEETGKSINVYKYLTSASDTEARIQYSAPDGYNIYRMFIYNTFNGDYSHSPKPGTYNMQLDISSAFDHAYDQFALASGLQYDNANYIDNYQIFAPQYSHGDIYFTANVTIASGLDRWGFRVTFQETNHNVDFTIRECFTVVNPDDDDNYTTVSSGLGSNVADDDYKSDVSSSLSNVNSSLTDISSSMQVQAENISAVETAVNNLRGAMEPHYDEVLTQLHHITEQLHAFWDQLYNMFYLPQYARLGEILTAIQNLDVNITVDVDGLKSTINTMSTNIQNKLGTVQTNLQGTLNTVSTNIQTKLQNVKDGIETELAEQSVAIQQKLDDKFSHLENGYDNSGIDEDAGRLDNTLNELQAAEDSALIDLVDTLKYSEISDFIDFDALFGVLAPGAVFSVFVHSIYLNLGAFKYVVDLFLLTVVASLLFGFYRFRSD